MIYQACSLLTIFYNAVFKNLILWTFNYNYYITHFSYFLRFSVPTTQGMFCGDRNFSSSFAIFQQYKIIWNILNYGLLLYFKIKKNRKIYVYNGHLHFSFLFMLLIVYIYSSKQYQYNGRELEIGKKRERVTIHWKHPAKQYTKLLMGQFVWK